MNSYLEQKSNYVPRQSIEIILNSKRGTQIGTLDGKKSYELEKEVSARKDEKLLIYLKKGFIPFSFYTISSSQNNHILDIQENNSIGGSNTYAITIPNGNYSITELLRKIKELMEDATTFNYVYSITYDDNTSKVSFLITSGTNVLNTKLLFSSGTNKQDTLCRVLGFKEDEDKTFTNSSSAISDFVVDMADGLDSLRCESNLVGDNIISTEGGVNGGELLIIPVDLSPNSILYFDEGNNPFKHELSMDSFKNVIITFSDNRGNVVDFNNVPYTLILIVEFVFNPNSVITKLNNNITQQPTTKLSVEEENRKLMLQMLRKNK